MDPKSQILLIAFIVLVIRIILATIATKRGRWGWWPWGVIGAELILALLLPAIEQLIGFASLITLIVMCFKKRKPQ